VSYSFCVRSGIGEEKERARERERESGVESGRMEECDRGKVVS